MFTQGCILYSSHTYIEFVKELLYKYYIWDNFL